jgi:8-oxo-dGTP diphosphatase
MKKPNSGRREEREFLASYDAARFPHPSVTADVAVLTVGGGRLQAVLIRRAEHPDRGRWGLPGGFVCMDESLDRAAARVLRDKAGLEGVFLEQLYTFGEPGRDPRTRVISVAHYALVEPGTLDLPGNGDLCLASLHVPWAGERGGPVEARDKHGKKLPLAFDHAEILGLAVKRLRGKLDYAPIGFELLPKEFTLCDLQSIHETILGRRLNKDSFRRRMLDSRRVVATGRREKAVGHRPAEFYRFVRTPKENG